MYFRNFMRTNDRLMPQRITQTDLEGYLDESLAAERMSQVESELRRRPELLTQLAAINHRRNAGVHSLGEIWRRYRLSCPTRDELGSLLLDVLEPEHARYIRFHIETAGCPYCAAKLTDLRRQETDMANQSAARKRKYFESSAGYLPKRK